RFLFPTRLYESADPAANSILVVQAEHFTLLHGNYSREGFFHPGPAYLYLMAAGQWLFHDLTHLVPTQWNGQLIAILLLNSALVATVAWIAGDWAGSAWGVATAAAVVVGFAAALSLAVPAPLNPEILASTWMPDVYVPTFLAFLVTGASVAAGRTAHLWLPACWRPPAPCGPVALWCSFFGGGGAARRPPRGRGGRPGARRGPRCAGFSAS